jgi:endonuclease/exonuclease/phosphatase (EEP) superfamily protein YafD
MRKTLDIASRALLSLAAIGLALRLTVRDAWPLTAWIFYFAGLPAVLAGLFLVGGLAALSAGRPRRFALATLMAIIVAAGWWTRAHYSNPCTVSPASVRIVSWNVARLGSGREQVVSDLIDLDPDVILLVEGGGDDSTAYDFWRERFSGYDISLPGGGIIAMFRGTIESMSFRKMIGISSYAQFDTVINGRPLRAVIVDLDASPRFDKRALVPRVFDLAVSGIDRPLLIAGDFNTPVDSPVFAPARRKFRHAFETAGTGLLATWPARYPITAIDHVWVDSSVTLLCTSLYRSTASDHRAVVVETLF